MSSNSKWNPDRMRELQKNWEVANKEARAAYRKQYYNDNKEKAAITARMLGDTLAEFEKVLKYLRDAEND